MPVKPPAITPPKGGITPPQGGIASLMDSRWRPALGWVSVASWAYALVVQPVIQTVLTIAGTPVVLPTIDPHAIDAALYGGLGLAAARTVEKLKK